MVTNRKVFFSSQFLEKFDLASMNLACYAAAGAQYLF